MKKLFLVFGCLALCLLAFLGCDEEPSVPEEVHVKSVSVTVTVKALKAGTVTLTATSRDGSEKKATCKITVK